MIARRACGATAWAWLLALVLGLGLVLPAGVMGAAWPVERSWSPEEETAFSEWVSGIGVRASRSINELVRDPERNRLHDARDEQIALYADCADLPVMLRAYYAWKRGLPFAVTQVGGGRYTRRGNRTIATYDNLAFDGTAQEFLRLIPQVLHSGNYRTEPDANDSLTYPIAIDARSLRPGAVFYSPEGHVGMVVEITEDGDVHLIDGHPDQTVTRIRFSSKLVWQSAARVGGFRAFRPVEVRGGSVAWVREAGRLAGFSVEQYGFADYYAEVRRRLATRMVDPLADLERLIREDLHAEVLDRVRAVELGWAVGREREVRLPPNIYDAVGDWENVSTPSRDLRLRRAFLDLPEAVRRSVRMARDEPERLAKGATRNPRRLGRALAKRKEELFRALTFTYVNSIGVGVTLTLADVEERLFRLSFDPNHPPELRWGAEGRELATAPRTPPRHFVGYEEQQAWRNRMEKKHGAMSLGDPDNPPDPPPHDLSALIETAIREEIGD